MEEDIKILEEKIKIIESLCTDDCINKSTVIDPLKYALRNSRSFTRIIRKEEVEMEKYKTIKILDECDEEEIKDFDF